MMVWSRSERLRCFLEALWLTGCRVSEVLGVQPGDVRQEGPLADLRVVGKGRKKGTSRRPRRSSGAFGGLSAKGRTCSRPRTATPTPWERRAQEADACSGGRPQAYPLFRRTSEREHRWCSEGTLCALSLVRTTPETARQHFCVRACTNTHERVQKGTRARLAFQAQDDGSIPFRRCLPLQHPQDHSAREYLRQHHWLPAVGREVDVQGHPRPAVSPQPLRNRVVRIREVPVH